MTCDYEAISAENQRRYGTDIVRYGPMLLTDRYDDRTHFIFELLQNAEDSLARRSDQGGLRKVTFTLTPTELVLSHFGKAFDEADVRGVCGIAESTKDKRSIGRFGIGFKSVYTFTERPEIHSGSEHFAIDNYVQPVRVEPESAAIDETRIVLPLKSEDATARAEIMRGFRQLGPSALLFLREIEEINWAVQNRSAGTYIRSSPESLGPNVNLIKLIGTESGRSEVDQTWLVFDRDVFSPSQEKLGKVEIAFERVEVKNKPGEFVLHPVATSPLVVFFPTVVSTNLGFLVQGPYRTTPSRDNVPREDAWNKHLVQETATLVVDSLRWLRDKNLLDANVLHCLPFDQEKFADSMFSPVFHSVRQAFLSESLLPGADGRYLTSSQAKLSRTNEVRRLFGAGQIAELVGVASAAWVSGDFTADKEPEIRQYLMQELSVVELTPSLLIARLTRAFLEKQADGWIVEFYEFLSRQEAALRNRIETIPLIRLDDGTHVVARQDGVAKAFLPSDIKTSFPTIRRAVCQTKDSRAFLASLGITEPHPVDDVILHLLPKYRGEDVEQGDDEYAADIERIRLAYSTDSTAQREKLRTALADTPFVAAIDAGDSSDCWAKPRSVYIATERLKQLFAGVRGVFIVDDTLACMKGEAVRDLLEGCGAVRYPRPLSAPNALTHTERLELRQRTGHPETSNYNDRVVDYTLSGFTALMDLLPTLSAERRKDRARLIWESLGDLVERRGRSIFEGSYTWTHNGNRKTPPFPAAFVRQLNASAWIPDAVGDLVLPKIVSFDSLGWNPDPFLLGTIAFKPPILDQLAREAGIDPDALDFLRKLGITSLAELTSRFRVDIPQDAAPATDQ